MGRIPLTLLLIISIALSGCISDHRIEDTRIAMDTDVTITVVHHDVPEAESAIERAFAEIYRIDGLMSCNGSAVDARDREFFTGVNASGVDACVTGEGGEVARLNKNGHLLNASPDLLYVVNKSVEYSELSNGSFDITVLPVINLWKEKIRAGSPPTDDEINETLELVNYKNISIENNSIYFREKSGSMKMTLGGIAKGYAIDRAIEVLKDHDIKHALVNAGGDIRVMGFKTENEAWRIALQNPKNKTEYITILNLCDISVATSGNYERYFSEEARASHIIDPKTGYAADELLSATIVAENATDADALATTVFVLGEAGGMELIERLDRVEGLIITGDRRILRSSGFLEFEVRDS